jgi:hypothetical protein
MTICRFSADSWDIGACQTPEKPKGWGLDKLYENVKYQKHLTFDLDIAFSQKAK